MFTHEPTIAKDLLYDRLFGYNSGMHEPSKLLLVGFMYCKYDILSEHMENLWHLINPNFKMKVSMRVIRNTLEDLLYIAIDQRLGMIMKDDAGT